MKIYIDISSMKGIMSCLLLRVIGRDRGFLTKDLLKEEIPNLIEGQKSKGKKKTYSQRTVSPKISRGKEVTIFYTLKDHCNLWHRVRSCRARQQVSHTEVEGDQV